MAPRAALLELEGVSEPLLRALADRNVTQLTPVQIACLPLCLAGKDVLAKAKTGTGKTLGFCIPTCERLLQSQASPKTLPEGIDPIRAIILSSTRELASQITTQAQQLLTHTNFNVEEILGGASITNQRERLDPKIQGFACKYGGTVDLMVATPGRLLEHIEGTEGFKARLRGVEVLVLDEVDMLLDGGFQRAIESIISELPTERQTLCFSATVPPKLLPVLSIAMVSDHAVVDCVGEEVDTHAKIEQGVLVHSLDHSLLALYQTVCDEMRARPDDYKIIAFLPTARATQFYTAVLQNIKLNVMEIHSRCSQSERNTVSDTFRNKNKVILLSSDVSARGVDYPDITLVLQVSAPTSKEQYVQRVGRTGRAGKSGRGILLLSDYEQDFLKQIKDLPTTSVKLNLECQSDMLALQEAAAQVDEELANQTYRAWIMAMVGQRKMLKWSKEDMVLKANLFAREVLGRKSTPPLLRDLVVTLGLQGIAALNIVDGPSAEELAQQEAAESAEETLSVKVHKKEMGLGLMKDAKKATDAIMALDEAAALALQAELDDKGVAIVAGFTILKDMVTIKKVKKTLTKSGSSSSLVSSGSCSTALSRNGSAQSLCALSRNSSAQSLASTDSAEDTTEQRAAPFRADADAVKAALARVAAAGAAISQTMAEVNSAGGDMKKDPRVVAATTEMAEAKKALSLAKTGKA